MTENLRIWDAVSKTNPANTKTVNQRGGFTAINANSQIMEATRQFGPIGIGWGYIANDPIFHETLMFVPVTLWHGDRSNTFGPVLGCEEWKVKDRVDSDAGKKATTDAVTKLLSQLGFNADVFLGLYDDQKYVEERKREFAAPVAPIDPNAKITDAQRDWLIGHAERSVGVAELCRHYGKTTVKDFTVGELEPARDWLKSPTAKAA